MLNFFDKFFLIIRVFILTLLSPFVLLLGPINAFRILGLKKISHKKNYVDYDEIIAIADKILLFKIFGKLFFRTRCLKRTLVLHRILRSYGFDVKAIIGFDRERNGVAGHAWLMLNGKKISDPIFTPQREFIPFVEIGAEVKKVKDA